MELSFRLKIVRIRLKIVSGSMGSASRPRRISPGISFRFHRNTKTAADTTAPIQLALE